MTAALWAVDAGGSNTRVDVDGVRYEFGSVNPASVGEESAEDNLRSVFAQVAAALAGRRGVGWVATATCNPPMSDELVQHLRDRAERAGAQGTLVVSNDAVPWLLAPPLSGRGVAVVAGTGAGFFASDGRSAPYRVGGCEYLGSDEGSAFHIGLAGMRAAVRARDGRGLATGIADLLAARLQRGPADIARDLAAKPYPKAAVAALAPVVCQAWQNGDETAGLIVADAIEELVTGARAARDGAGLADGWAVAAGGGLLLGCPALFDELSRRLRAELGAADVGLVSDPTRTIVAAAEAWIGRSDGEVRVPDAFSELVRPVTLRTSLVTPRRGSDPTRDTLPTDRPVVGLCLAAWGGVGIERAIEDAAAVRAEAVDLPTDSTLSLVELRRWAIDADYRRQLRELAANVRVSCVSNSRDTQLLLGPHGPHTDPVLPGPVWRKQDHALRYAEDTVRLAADLGATHARLMFGVADTARWLSWHGSEVSWAENIRQWCAQAEPVLALAMEYGVTLLVEPHPKQTAYDDLSARALLDAVDQAGARGVVRLCLDPANLAAVGHDPVRVVRGWGDDLAAVHAKDLQIWADAGAPRGAGWSRYGPGPAVRFRALGAGDMPWPAIVAALLDEGFRGVVYVEHEDALLARHQSVTRSMGYVREFLPRISPEGRTW
ncbi:TIM barrel protein [Micromonospora arborensis]|uniref:TIM barrel protein n=1 Tax=Micromonospora arborensis TaxID=2116518 RepID=UPI003420ED5A